jgi:lipopolysaccharide assembly protein A
MRPLRALAAFLFLVAGGVLGVLNPAPVMVDLGLVHLRAGLGVILLCTLLIGVLLGGLAMTASVVLPLRQELRRRRKTEPAPPSAEASFPASPSPEP